MYQYSIDYFINKFENIKDETCTTKTICKGGAGSPLVFDCLGHCRDGSGRFNKAEQFALLNCGNYVIQAWDGNLSGFTQETPRLRLIAYLKAVKSNYVRQE
jgi:hypothetical protein